MRPKLWMYVISSAGNLAELQDDFEQRFIVEGAPKDATMFSGVGMAANIVTYFSPAAVAIFGAALAASGAESCVTPDKLGITPVAGHRSGKASVKIARAKLVTERRPGLLRN
jgi:hypothetical protein